MLIAPTMTLKAQEEEATTKPTLAERISALESKSALIPKFSGMVYVRYQYGSGNVNAIDLRRARLKIAGDLSSMFEYCIQLDFVKSGIIGDAYAKWKIVKEFNIEGGQFKIPFSLHNPLSPTDLECIEDPMFMSEYIPDMGRDLGFMFYGTLFKNKQKSALLTYNVALVNGSGPNTKDDNTAKNLVGRVDFNVVKGLTLSGSFYEGKIGTIHKAVKDPDTGESEGGVNHKRIYAASASYKDHNFNIRGEYFQGRSDYTKSRSAYIMAAYGIKDKYFPVVRYDFFDNDIDNANGHGSKNNYTIGITYWPVKYAGVQLNYMYKETNKDKEDGGIKRSNDNLVSLQCFLRF